MNIQFIIATVILLILFTHLTNVHKVFNLPASKSMTIIWFYRPGCGWCDKMNPEWERFEKMAPSNLTLKKINTAEEQEMAEDFGVQGVPFIVKVVDGKRKVFQGERSAENFMRFCKE